MKFAENFRKLLKQKNRTQADAAEFCGVSDNTISNWVNKRAVPSIDTMQQIADWFGVSLQELLFGDEATTSLDIVAVPEYDIDFSCGNGKSLFEDRDPVRYVYYLRSWFVENSINPRRAVRVRIKGDSMKPFLWEGDSALLNLDEVHVVDGGVYAFGIDDDLFIKRLSIVPGTGLRVVSDNEAYAPQVLEYERFDGRLRVFGRVRDKSGRGGL